VPLSNSCSAAQNLGGVGGDDRTGKADRISREDSSSASETQPAARGGEPTKAAWTAGVVGVPRSSEDPPDSITGGERGRGTWVNACGTGEGLDDGRAAVETLFDRITTPAKVQNFNARSIAKPRLHRDTGFIASTENCCGARCWKQR